MGVQSAVAHYGGVPGITTPYFTGTLTNIVVGAVGRTRPRSVPGQRPPGRIRWPALSFLAYVTGAALTGFLLGDPMPALAPAAALSAVPAVVIAGVLLIAPASGMVGALRARRARGWQAQVSGITDGRQAASASGQRMRSVPRSEPDRPAPGPGPRLQRAQGRARVRVCSARNGTTRLSELYQEGCLKVRLPHSETGGEISVAVINTAGGLTRGDSLSVDVVLEEGARATVTTPACERIYRSIGGEVSIGQRLQVGRGARLDWLPQETILFDRARLRRRFDVELEAGAEVTLSEVILHSISTNDDPTTGGAQETVTLAVGGVQIS